MQFYRRPARTAWTPTGTNVPGYPELPQLRWPNVANAVSGSVSPQAAMDALAARRARVLERLERAGTQGDCGPKLNPEEDPKVWLARPAAPKPELDDEKPPGETVPCNDLIDVRRFGRAR